MASTASQLEQGYEKIFRWCSYEFLQIGRDSQLEVSTTMREAVRRLRKRPELLKYVDIETRNSSQVTSLFLLVNPSPLSLSPGKQHLLRPSLQPSLVGDPLVFLDPSNFTHTILYDTLATC